MRPAWCQTASGGVLFHVGNSWCRLAMKKRTRPRLSSVYGRGALPTACLDVRPGRHGSLDGSGVGALRPGVGRGGLFMGRARGAGFVHEVRICPLKVGALVCRMVLLQDDPRRRHGLDGSRGGTGADRSDSREKGVVVDVRVFARGAHSINSISAWPARVRGRAVDVRKVYVPPRGEANRLRPDALKPPSGRTASMRSGTRGRGRSDPARMGDDDGRTIREG